MPSFEETNNPGYDEVFPKQEKFSFFKKIGQYFNSLKVEQGINDLIDNDLFVMTFDELKKGYQLSKAQERKLEEKLVNRIDDMSFFNDLIEQGVTFPEKYVAIFCIKNSALLNEHYALFNEGREGLYSYQGVKKWLHEYKDNKNLESIIVDYMIVKLREINKVSLIHDFRFTDYISNPLMHFYSKDFFDNVSIEKKQTMLELVKKVGKKNNMASNAGYVSSIVRDIKRSLEKEPSIAPAVKEVESLNIILSTLEVKNLPIEILSQIDQIKSNYLNLNAIKEELNNEQKFNIKNLYHNKLPEIISQYLSLNTRCVEDIKNTDGKNANQLLKETLADINDIFNTIHHQISEVKVADLNVTNRYLNEVKTNIKM